MRVGAALSRSPRQVGYIGLTACIKEQKAAAAQVRVPASISSISILFPSSASYFQHALPISGV